MEYITLHPTTADFNSKKDSFAKPHVAYVVETNTVDYQPYVDPSGGHEYVDLGLPSGTKWATMNVGANSITDTGLYFQWGDTQGYTADQVGSGEGKKAFAWEDYKYWTSDAGSGLSGVTKYNSTDHKTVLDAEDDTVVTNWGGSWKMPTVTQFNELLNNSYCTNVWTGITVGGTTVYGRLFTSKSNGNTLFFPAAGNCNDGSVSLVGSGGNYWLSSLYSSDVTSGRRLYFTSSSISMGYRSRSYGCSVRGVLADA